VVGGVIARLGLAACCATSATRATAHAQSSSLAVQSPPRLEVRVPFEPTAFPSAGSTHLFYELHIRNSSTVPTTLRRIEVLDAARAPGPSIAAFESDPLIGILQPFDRQTPADGTSDRRRLAPGSTVIVFMSLALDRRAHVPDKLLNRVVTSDFTDEGTAIETHHTNLRVLGPPLEGAAWLAADGPGNDEDNHHRRGVLVLAGRPVISRRYAIDWKRVENSTSYSGDSQDKGSYFSYGKSVLAVADGRVVTARDGLPDNVPGHGEEFHPAIPLTMETVPGNTITLDIGGGQFVYFCHLRPGSLRVTIGDHVRRGQILARVGVSGDAREPHLHIEVTTDAHFAAGEGVPYVIDTYRVADGHGNATSLRTREMPLNNVIVDFAKSAATR